MPEYIKVDEVCSYLLSLANEFDKNDKYYPEKHLGEKAKTLRMLSKKFYGFPGNVEIVRCKDCKWFSECVKGVDYINPAINFCSIGERKDNE